MAKRIDSNQVAVVKAFREQGATVQILSDVGKGCPDIVVGLFGYNFLIEIKNGKKPPSGRKLTEQEDKFFKEWKGQVCIIYSVEDVARFIESVKSLMNKGLFLKELERMP